MSNTSWGWVSVARALAVIALVVVAGCAHAPTFTEYSQQLSTTMCDRFESCHVADAPPRDQCALAMATLFACTAQDLEAGKHTYHPEAARQCVKHVRSTTCEDFVANGVKSGVCLDVLGDTKDHPIECNMPRAQHEAAEQMKKAK